MILSNKGKRQTVNNNNQNHYNPSPTPNSNHNLNYFNDNNDTLFNDSTAFQPAAQSTYYQPPTPQVNHKQAPLQPAFFDPGQNQQTTKTNKHSNGNSNMYNPNQNFQPGPDPKMVPQLNQFHNGNQAQQQPGLYNPAAQLFNDPMANMAVKYGSTLADQGKEYVTQNVDRWFSISKLKFYFAVDTTYVAKKLALILFPFLNKDWSVKYSQSEAVPPKLDVNAPDLYIPVMSFVTYLLIVGVCLGVQEKFAPELLGIQASSALGWFVIEIGMIWLMMQILQIKSALKTFDIMSFCGYKYLGMILCLMSSLLFNGLGYTLTLFYMCLAITYFMVRNLKLMILASPDDPNNTQGAYAENGHMSGNKRRIYVLLFIAFLQPLFMWWLTRHLTVSSV